MTRIETQMLYIFKQSACDNLCGKGKNKGCAKCPIRKCTLEDMKNKRLIEFFREERNES